MPHALVVDDDPSTVLLLSGLLETRGFSIRTAGSLEEARRSLEPIPDICVVDLCLPDGEGTELLSDGLAERSDFVVLTGHATVESGVEAMRLGASDYVAKPLTSSALDRLLARFGNSPRTGEDAARRANANARESPEMGRESALAVRLGDSLGEVEQRLILLTVSHCRTQDEAARMLGISTKTLYNKLRLYESQRRSADAKARFTDARPPEPRWT